MAAIEIPDSLYARLQKLAVPLVDTPATLLERLINVYEVHLAPVSPSARESNTANTGRSAQPQREFGPNTAPSLRHTRVIAADFAGRKADGWNSLVHAAHIEAVRRLGSLEAVRRVSAAKIVPGRASAAQEKVGYRYVAEINACIQNVDTTHAWANTFRLAKALNVSVEVDFVWLTKSEAAHPGKAARLVWKPKNE